MLHNNMLLTEMALTWGNDPFSDKPMHFKRVEQELFVGCLCGNVSTKKLDVCDGSNNTFLIQGIMIQAVFFGRSILRFKKVSFEPARKIMEFLVRDEILGFVDEFFFFHLFSIFFLW